MYRFYSTPIGNCRVAVAGQYDADNQLLKIAVARCSNKDNFVRKTGRLIAEGRLNKGKLYTTYNLATPPKSEDFIEYAKNIAEIVAITKNCITFAQ